MPLSTMVLLLASLGFASDSAVCHTLPIDATAADSLPACRSYYLADAVFLGAVIAESPDSLVVVSVDGVPIARTTKALVRVLAVWKGDLPDTVAVLHTHSWGEICASEPLQFIPGDTLYFYVHGGPDASYWPMCRTARRTQKPFDDWLLGPSRRPA